MMTLTVNVFSMSRPW